MLLNKCSLSSSEYSADYVTRLSVPLLCLCLVSVFSVTALANTETASGSSAGKENLSHFGMNSMENYSDPGPFENEDTLFVREFLLAEDVIEREPVEVVESYTMADSRAWCFARIYNNDEMQDLYFKWYYENELYFEMNSKIGISPNWRTYSSVGLQPGNWRVALQDEQGNVLEEIEFVVSE